MKICILIPAYNESKKLKNLLPELKKSSLDILVVDDGSCDDTEETAKKAGVMTLRHKRNSGKGQALQSGFKYILKQGYDAVITMDADLQHDTRHIPDFIKAYESRDADIILGDRMLETACMPRLRLWTNKITSVIISFLTGSSIRDTQSGFRLIRRKVLEDIELSTSKFDTESELLIKALAKGFKVDYIPIRTIYFEDHKSKIKPLIDTLRFIRLVYKAVFIWR
jgi:glycosyltransferase involved in cell wall biosynthesis